MTNYKKRNIILVVISAFILVVVALIVSKVTYSYLEPVDPDDVKINSEITATGDTLLFTKGTDIEVTLNQDNFGGESGNLVRSVTPQVKLIASNKTNNAEATYYVSVNISENTFRYTNGVNNPEILLTVTDNEGNPLTTCTGLTYTTVGGVSGFDITEKLGLYDFPIQTISTTSSTAGTTKNWTYTVTFINKETDQSINEDAKINIQAILHKEPEDFCVFSPDSLGCGFSLAFNPATTTNVKTLENGNIYYHGESLVNGAHDGSFRYSGANPNNFVCFGTGETPCPETNLYRIIGIVPVDVVVNEETYQVEKKMLYKVIRNSPVSDKYFNSEIAGSVQKKTWSGANSTQDKNTWDNSNLNNWWLNYLYANSIIGRWPNMIANVLWSVGGNTWANLVTTSPVSTTYNSEVLNPVTTGTTNNKTKAAAKIGLMYLSDYGYAAPSSAWSGKVFDYSDSSINSNNWLYLGDYEWTITRVSDGTTGAITIIDDGSVGHSAIWGGYDIRPVFYLDESAEIDMTAHAGTSQDPYRITGNGQASFCNLHSHASQCNNFGIPSLTVVKDDIIHGSKAVSGDGYLYHHNDNLMFYGANDDSFRYAGPNPNNYICFGSNVTPCPTSNIFRIIGLVPVDVVVDGTTTQRKYLFKLIRHEYLTASEIGITREGDAPKPSEYLGPKNNQPTGAVDAFYWSGSSGNSSSTWSDSTINTKLNSDYLTSLGASTNKIANVMWKVGGNTINNIQKMVPMENVYKNEIISPSSAFSSDGKTEIANKVGMMYVTDFVYSTSNVAWNDPANTFKNYAHQNWMYRGIYEWTMTRNTDQASYVYNIGAPGNVNVNMVNQRIAGIRPTFYLTEDTVIDMVNHSGTIADPYRVNSNS